MKLCMRMLTQWSHFLQSFDVEVFSLTADALSWTKSDVCQLKMEVFLDLDALLIYFSCRTFP